jgi:hypothetical protein
MHIQRHESQGMKLECRLENKGFNHLKVQTRLSIYIFNCRQEMAHRARFKSIWYCTADRIHSLLDNFQLVFAYVNMLRENDSRQDHVVTVTNMSPM